MESAIFGIKKGSPVPRTFSQNFCTSRTVSVKFKKWVMLQYTTITRVFGQSTVPDPWLRRFLRGQGSRTKALGESVLLFIHRYHKILLFGEPGRPLNPTTVTNAEN